MRLTFGLLPSPDTLDIPSCNGEDKTNTLMDYLIISNFVDESGGFLWNSPSRDQIYENIRAGRTIEQQRFGPLMEEAYKLAFDPLRLSSDEEEMIFFYFAGHGLSQDNVDVDLTEEERNTLPVPKMPNLVEDYFADADQRLTQGQLRQGALYLHHRGFCDLRGLLRPFIAALEYNRAKKNKHFLIVVDSCYSGVFARDLDEMRSNGELTRWLNNACSITVQTSSRSDEPTFGGYFTPCFVKLNDLARRGQLLSEWNDLKAEDKAEFLEDFADDLPTPTFASTREIENNDNPFLEMRAGNSTITLFNDPDFFKFCFIKLDSNGVSAPRALSESDGKKFLRQPSYTILDFKLKKYQRNDTFQGTPMGLFLVDWPWPNVRNLAVCVHVHYNNLFQANTFKLFEHEKDRNFYAQVGDGSDSYNATRAGSLISQCKEFVKQRIQPSLPQGTNFESWWMNADNWKMKGTGFCKLFRKQRRTVSIRNALRARNE